MDHGKSLCFAKELDIESGKRGSRVFSVGNRDKIAHWLRWNRILEKFGVMEIWSYVLEMLGSGSF